MKSSVAIAEWLLTAFGVDESLHGDLVEEGAGRSGTWLLWQTAAAIAAHVGRDLRDHDLRNHGLLAIRAIATGWLLIVGWGQMFHWAEVWARHRGMTPLIALTVLVWPAFVGWAIARTHRRAMVLAYVASGVLWSIGYYTAHYDEILRMPVANLLGTDLLLTSIILVSTLAGGFWRKRARG